MELEDKFSVLCVCVNPRVTFCVIKDKFVKVSLPGFCRYTVEKILSRNILKHARKMQHYVMPSEWKL